MIFLIEVGMQILNYGIYFFIISRVTLFLFLSCLTKRETDA